MCSFCENVGFKPFSAPYTVGGSLHRGELPARWAVPCTVGACGRAQSGGFLHCEVCPCMVGSCARLGPRRPTPWLCPCMAGSWLHWDTDIHCLLGMSLHGGELGVHSLCAQLKVLLAMEARMCTSAVAAPLGGGCVWVFCSCRVLVRRWRVGLGFVRMLMLWRSGCFPVFLAVPGCGSKWRFGWCVAWSCPTTARYLPTSGILRLFAFWCVGAVRFCAELRSSAGVGTAVSQCLTGFAL